MGGCYKGLAKQEQIIPLHAHSLVTCVRSIVIIKVIPIKNPSSFNQDSETTEHYMPGVPAQGSSMCAKLHHSDLQCVWCVRVFAWRAHRVWRLNNSKSDVMAPVDESTL